MHRATLQLEGGTSKPAPLWQRTSMGRAKSGQQLCCEIRCCLSFCNFRAFLTCQDPIVPRRIKNMYGKSVHPCLTVQEGAVYERRFRIQRIPTRMRTILRRTRQEQQQGMVRCPQGRLRDSCHGPGQKFRIRHGRAAQSDCARCRRGPEGEQIHIPTVSRHPFQQRQKTVQNPSRDIFLGGTPHQDGLSWVLFSSGAPSCHAGSGESLLLQRDPRALPRSRCGLGPRASARESLANHAEEARLRDRNSALQKGSKGGLP